MTYTLEAPHYIDMAFECTLRDVSLTHCPELVLIWATYLTGLRERALHFWGTCAEGRGWLSVGDEGMYARIAAEGAASIQGDEVSPLCGERFVLPFCYVLVDGDGHLAGKADTLVFALFFRRGDLFRFMFREWSPDSSLLAWQFIMRAPKAGETYAYRARAVYKPWVDAEDIRDEYRRWAESLPPSTS